MKIYLAGPMSNIPDLNYPAFHSGAAVLRGAGHEVFNPAEQFGGDQSLPYKTYMREDIGIVLKVDAVAVLDGWERSRGANVEVAVARAIGIPVVRFDEDGQFLPVVTP